MDTFRKDALTTNTKKTAYNYALYKIIFIYIPSALIPIISYYSVIYISLLRDMLGVYSDSIPITILHMVEASTSILIPVWHVLALAFMFFCFVLSMNYITTHQTILTPKAKNFIKKFEYQINFILLAIMVLLSTVISLSYLYLIVYASDIAEDRVTKIKQQITQKEKLSTITLNDKIVEEGIIVAMSDSMVWIYNGKETVAMKIGNHKIKTPIAK